MRHPLFDESKSLLDSFSFQINKEGNHSHSCLTMNSEMQICLPLIEDKGFTVTTLHTTSVPLCSLPSRATPILQAYVFLSFVTFL